MTRTFPTEVNWRVYFLVHGIGATFVPICFVLGERWQDGWDGPLLTFLGFVLLVVLIPSALGEPRIQYKLTESELCIYPRLYCKLAYFGFPSRLRLDLIVEAFPVTTTFWIYGCVLSGFQVNFTEPDGRKRSVRIAPRERDEFLSELERNAPQLMRAGDRLVRIAVPKYVG